MTDIRIIETGSLIQWPSNLKFKATNEEGKDIWVMLSKDSGHIWTPYIEGSKCPVCGNIDKHSTMVIVK